MWKLFWKSQCDCWNVWRRKVLQESHEGALVSLLGMEERKNPWSERFLITSGIDHLRRVANRNLLEFLLRRVTRSTEIEAYMKIYSGVIVRVPRTDELIFFFSFFGTSKTLFLLRFKLDNLRKKERNWIPFVSTVTLISRMHSCKSPWNGRLRGSWKTLPFLNGRL